jgi:hypothetical protein
MCGTYYSEPPSNVLYKIFCAFSSDGLNWTIANADNDGVLAINDAVSAASSLCPTNAWGCLSRAEPSLVLNTADVGSEIWLYFADVRCRGGSCGATTPIAERGISLAKVSDAAWTAAADPSFTLVDGDGGVAGHQPIILQDETYFDPDDDWDGYSTPNAIKVSSSSWLMAVSTRKQEDSKFNARQLTLLKSTDGLSWSTGVPNLLAASGARLGWYEYELRSPACYHLSGTLYCLFSGNNTPTGDFTDLRMGIGSFARPLQVASTAPPAIDPTTCPASKDKASTLIFLPEARACTATNCADGSGGSPVYLTWTRDRIAKSHDYKVLFGTNEEQPTGGDFAFSTTIPSPRNINFGLHFTNPNPETSAVNLLTWLNDVKARVSGGNGPTYLVEHRFDLVYLQQLYETGAYAMDGDMFLWSDRSHTAFVAWWERNMTTTADILRCGANGNGCCWSNYRGVPNAYDESYCSGSNNPNNSEQYFMATKLAQIQTGLGASSVKYIDRSTAPNPNVAGSGTHIFHGIAVLADLLDTDYQDMIVEYIEDKMTYYGAAGVMFNNKNHFYISAETGTATAVSNWVNIGDGLSGLGVGGRCPGIIGTLDSLEELDRCQGGVYSGPPERSAGNGGTAFNWAAYSQGQVEIARKLYSHSPRIPYGVIVNANIFRGCPTTWVMDSTYDHADCDDIYDTSAGSGETAELREIVMKSKWAYVDLQGKAETGSIGSGAGSGYTFAQMRTMMLNPDVGEPEPDEVLVYDQNQPNATAPKLCLNPSETNPDTPKLTAQ